MNRRRRTYHHTCKLNLCGKKFDSNSPKSLFCSEGCKQRHWRIQHGAAPDRHIGNANGAQTKSEQTVNLICEYCGEGFTRNGNAAGNSLYCSDAHKQAAYRDRHPSELSKAMELTMKQLFREDSYWINPRTATALINRGLIRRENRMYTLTEQGRPIAEAIAEQYQRRLIEAAEARKLAEALRQETTK